MMGVGHAVLGTTAWLGTATYVLPALGVSTPIVGATSAIGAVGMLALSAHAAAGASLTPDIDHPNGTMANSAGFLTRAIAHGANALSGGHREGTHRLWFWFAVTVACFGTVGATGGWAAMAWFYIFTAFGAQALSKTHLHQHFNKKWKQNTGIFAKAYAWAYAAVITGIAIAVEPDATQWWWLPWAVSIGHLSHLVGDSLTTAGLTWAKGHKVRFPILGDAGSDIEMIFTAALGVLCGIWFVAIYFGTDPIRWLIGVIAQFFGG